METALPLTDAPVAVPRGPGARYWVEFPMRWGRQIFRNGYDIGRVLDITRFRQVPEDDAQ